MIYNINDKFNYIKKKIIYIYIIIKKHINIINNKIKAVLLFFKII